MSVRGEKVNFVQGLFLVLMRWAVGWHLAVEGWAKLDDPNWTAKEYLQSSTGPLAEYFHQIANNEAWLRWADWGNPWGLLVIGACLLLGLFTRLSCLLGFLMLGAYFVCHPPMGVWGEGFLNAAGEGTYLFVDKVLIEGLALAVLAAFPTGQWIGLDAFIWPAIRHRMLSQAMMEQSSGRRQIEVESSVDEVEQPANEAESIKLKTT